jgi:hypothetical protein
MLYPTLFLFLNIALAASPFFALAARPLNSVMLAVGKWDVSLQGPCWMDASRIFPLNSCASSDGPRSNLSVKRRPWGAKLDCTLSMAEDGTFILSPNSVKGGGGNSSQKQGVLTVRGQWNVMSNPYCVTDRFYDTLSLQSYPRKKTTIISKESGSSMSVKKRQEEIAITLHCRMWGRHDRKPNKRNEKLKSVVESDHEPSACFGRMTHGTMVWRQTSNDDDSKQQCRWWSKWYRPVVASFSAKRCSRFPVHDGWVHQKEFGY